MVVFKRQINKSSFRLVFVTCFSINIGILVIVIKKFLPLILVFTLFI